MQGTPCFSALCYLYCFVFPSGGFALKIGELVLPYQNNIFGDHEQSAHYCVVNKKINYKTEKVIFSVLTF